MRVVPPRVVLVRTSFRVAKEERRDTVNRLRPPCGRWADVRVLRLGEACRTRGGKPPELLKGEDQSPHQRKGHNRGYCRYGGFLHFGIASCLGVFDGEVVR